MIIFTYITLLFKCRGFYSYQVLYVHWIICCDQNCVYDMGQSIQGQIAGCKSNNWDGGNKLFSNNSLSCIKHICV